MSFNPRNPAKYKGTDKTITFFVSRDRSPTGADYRQPETGKLYTVGTVWQVAKSPTTGTEGDLWALSKISANIAYWVQFTSGVTPTGSMLTLSDEVNALTYPTDAGNIKLDGVAVANGTNPSGIPLETVSGANKIDFNLQVSSARTGAPSDKNDAGICSFDNTSFAVDGDGYVTLAGGLGPAVDTNIGDDAISVSPNGSGEFTWIGHTVENATHSKPVYFKESATANAIDLDVQVGKARTGVPADKNNAGLVSFDDTSFAVTEHGYVTFTGTQNTEGYSNLGVSYASGTGVFTVTSASGSPLSGTNFAIVKLPSKSIPGTFVTYTVTADQSFIDDVGASQIIGNLFEFNSGVFIVDDVPFFIYAVAKTDETAIAFMISRTPNKSKSPVAANIGIPGTPGTNAQTSMFSIPTITAADYAEQPVLCIGSIRMRKSASDDWTVQDLLFTDGIGQYNSDTIFTAPEGQFGANANTYTRANGGTAAVYDFQSVEYVISRDGWVSHKHLFGNTTVQSGAGAGAAQFIVMFLPSMQYIGVGVNVINAVWRNCTHILSLNNKWFVLARDGVNGALPWSSFTAPESRTINCSMNYIVLP